MMESRQRNESLGCLKGLQAISALRKGGISDVHANKPRLSQQFTRTREQSELQDGLHNTNHASWILLGVLSFLAVELRVDSQRVGFYN